jgi:hypothetical protein
MIDRGELNLMNEITIGCNSKSEKDKTLRIINEHKKWIDQPTKE